MKKTGMIKKLLVFIMLVTLCAAGLPAQEAEAAEGSAPGKTHLTECRNMTYGIRLQWTEAEGAYGYRVLRRAMNETGFTCIKTTKNLVFRDRDVEPSQFYYYKIRPYSVVDGKNAWVNARMTKWYSAS